MLKGISPLVFPDLLKARAEMGHGDEIIFSDAHFPAYSLGVPVFQAPGVNVPQMLDAVLPLLKLDDYVEHAAIMMKAMPGDELDMDYVRLCTETLQKHGENNPIGFIDRFDFYERAARVHCVVVTGETRKYGNFLIKKGVI